MVRGFILIGLVLSATSAVANCLDKSRSTVSTAYQVSPACIKTPVSVTKGELLYGSTGEDPITVSDVWDGGYSFVTTITTTYVEQITNVCTKKVVSSKTFTEKQKVTTRYFVITGYELSYGTKRFYHGDDIIKAMRSTEASANAEMPELHNWCEKGRLQAKESYKNYFE